MELLAPLAVFAVVVLFQLLLVAVAGTDIPFYDQWGIEGGWLYPSWRDGSLRAIDLVRPFNEHRILWTHLLNLGLFAVNGQWDPLVQLTAIAGLRGAVAAGLAWFVGTEMAWCGRVVVSAGVAFAFLPHLAWHNVLWGIESHSDFVLGFSLLALFLLGNVTRSVRQTWGGLASGVAALLSMGPGALVPVSLLGFVALGAVESRRVDRATWRQAWPALALLGVALALRAPVPDHAKLSAVSWPQFFLSMSQLLSWPHGGQPYLAFPTNLPLFLVVTGRILHRRIPSRGEDIVLLVAGWSLAIVLATAWVRGGSDELLYGVPSRYVDFLVLLPLANVWCVVLLVRECAARWFHSVRLVAAAWLIFLFVGWLGLSMQMMSHIILPRARDRDAPVRLMQEFQRTAEAGVFAGQPRLLVPHPNLAVVQSVLTDPRMKGSLPPSLQAAQPMGPLSHAARKLLGR